MATFSVDPTYVFEDAIQFKTQITTYEDGSEQRHALGSPKRMFTLRFLAVTEATRDTIHAFHQARYGAAESFTWTNPLDSTVYTVRFINDALEEQNIGYNDTDGDIFNIECQFLEVV